MVTLEFGGEATAAVDTAGGAISSFSCWDAKTDTLPFPGAPHAEGVTAGHRI